MNSPCFNCKERENYVNCNINCHMECEAYARFRTLRNKISENRKIASQSDCYTAESYDRMRRLRRHGKQE